MTVAPPAAASVVVLLEPSTASPQAPPNLSPPTSQPLDTKPSKDRTWGARIVASSIGRVFGNDWAVCCPSFQNTPVCLAEQFPGIDNVELVPSTTLHAGSDALSAEQWNALAAHAVGMYQPKYLVLLRRGYTCNIKHVVDAVKASFKRNPSLRCLAIADAQEPGTPAALALHVEHLATFDGQLFPASVNGLDSNHFLYNLYRRIGASDCHLHATVQRVGGVVEGPCVAEGSNMARPARWLRQLDAWGVLLRERYKRVRVAVDVCVPSYRVQVPILQRIVSCPWDRAVADVRFVVQVDNPKHPPDALHQLAALRATMGHRLTIRTNATNLGRSNTRNALLEGSGAEYCIFFDDDVEPWPGCIDAYVRAFVAHPAARCFAGPTYMPQAPRMLPMAFRMSGAIEFWETPGEWGGEAVPWAITANVAYKHSDVRFRFPKKGGGEDVDVCLQLGARAMTVIDARATHPWWPGTYRKYCKRVFRWAEGDGLLMKMWPLYAYVAAPSPLLCMLTTMALALCRAMTLHAAALAIVAMATLDVVSDVLRECCSRKRRRYTPGPSELRPWAAALSTGIKAAAEGGRVYGHIKVGRPLHVLVRFDWFCGYEPAYVRAQQRMAAFKCALCVVGGVVGWWMGMSW